MPPHNAVRRDTAGGYASSAVEGALVTVDQGVILEPPRLQMGGALGWLAVEPESFARALLDAAGSIPANEICTLVRNLELKLSNRGAAAQSYGVAVRSMQVGLSNGNGEPKISLGHILEAQKRAPGHVFGVGFDLCEILG